MASTKREIQHDFYVYVDTVVLTVNQERGASVAPRDRLEVLVMRRPGSGPDQWALPGGAVLPDEPLEDTAQRKVKEETGIRLRKRDLHQIGAFGDPDRDARWRAISVAYLALLPHPGGLRPEKHSIDARFIPYRHLLSRRMLEFDHAGIIAAARQRAHDMLEDSPIATSFCRPSFTMSDLRVVYEAFLQREVDPANFRRKVESAADFIEAEGIGRSSGFASTGRGRPPMYYRAGPAREITPPIRFRPGRE